MKNTINVTSCLPFTVIRDSQEKTGHGWEFGGELDNKSRLLCEGTIIRSLPTADYTLVGFEHILCIERKGTITEFVGNLVSSVFEAELKRMSEFPLPYLILEFGMTQVMNWPDSSRLSLRIKRKLPLRKEGAVLARIMDLQFKYPRVNFQFVDFYGKEMSFCIFKRAIEKYADQRK